MCRSRPQNLVFILHALSFAFVSHAERRQVAMLQATSSKVDQVVAREKVCHCEFRAKCTCEAAKSFMEPLDDGVCQRHCDYGDSCQSMQRACPKLKFTCDRKAMAWSCDSKALLQAHSGSHQEPQEGESSEAKEEVKEKESKEEGNEDKASDSSGESGEKTNAEGSEEDDSQAAENSGDSGEKTDAEGGEAGDSQASENSGDSGEKTDAEGGDAGDSQASENSGEAEEKPDAEGGGGDQSDASESSGDSGEKVDAKKSKEGKAANVTSGSSGNSTAKSKGGKKNATKASEGSDAASESSSAEGGKDDGASENSTDAGADVIAPFGKEDTARELQKRASSSQDTLVDAIENSMVAEMKRSIFRSLSRLRAAEIKEFDTIARLETKAFDEFNDNFQYREQNPLKYVGEEEGEVSQDKLSAFH